MRFGVNCYGNKPDITSRESKLMNNQTLYPKSLEDYEIDKKSEQYKKQLDKILDNMGNDKTGGKGKKGKDKKSGNKKGNGKLHNTTVSDIIIVGG